MSIDLPRLAHPGPRAPDRRQAVAATLRPITGRLRAGRPVMDEVARLFADHGARGGMLSLEGVVCDPMRFVLPALATDAAHAAFYSATHAPGGPVRIGASTASVGWRDGAALLNCHGQWSGGFGTAMGHLEKVSESRGMNSVSDLANELKISERQLERIFKQYVGLSPKFYSRIIRFSTIFQLKEQGDPNWIDLTYESGFADQSHFIRNFKAFTGEDPSSYSFGDQNMANFFMKKK
jgi:AraC-like DNA-binding protein